VGSRTKTLYHREIEIKWQRMCPDVTFDRRPVIFKQEAVKGTGTGSGFPCSFEWSLVEGSNNALHKQAFTRGGDLCSGNTCKKKSW